MRRIITLCLILVFLSVTLIPFSTFAATGSDRICAQARKDAEINVNKVLWGGIGCILGPIGVLLGYFVEPSVPANRILGKSSDYVIKYSSCYKSRGKELQGTASLIGCGIGTAISIIYYVVAFAMLSS